MTTEPAATAGRLAAIHAAAFDTPWTTAAFAALLDQAGVHLIEAADGFILMRTVLDEAEILTLAVAPAARRQGLGGRLVGDGLDAAARDGAARAFLEVAEGNAAARALYAAAGFVEVGRRPGYYARSDGPAEDALLLALNLPGRLPTP